MGSATAFGAHPLDSPLFPMSMRGHGKLAPRPPGLRPLGLRSKPSVLPKLPRNPLGGE
ncbi:hypothetical protein FRC08_007073, partial [Ceratobasidium sp. 394]